MRAKRVVTVPLQPYFGFHWLSLIRQTEFLGNRIHCHHTALRGQSVRRWGWELNWVDDSKHLAVLHCGACADHSRDAQCTCQLDLDHGTGCPCIYQAMVVLVMGRLRAGMLWAHVPQHLGNGDQKWGLLCFSLETVCFPLKLSAVQIALANRMAWSHCRCAWMLGNHSVRREHVEQWQGEAWRLQRQEKRRTSVNERGACQPLHPLQDPLTAIHVTPVRIPCAGSPMWCSQYECIFAVELTMHLMWAPTH